MIDQELGAMIGSAWHERHSITSEFLRKSAEGRFMNALLIPDYPNASVLEAAFTYALRMTLEGKCYECGSSSEVGRDDRGVYICLSCMESRGE